MIVVMIVNGGMKRSRANQSYGFCVHYRVHSMMALFCSVRNDSKREVKTLFIQLNYVGTEQFYGTARASLGPQASGLVS